MHGHANMVRHEIERPLDDGVTTPIDRSNDLRHVRPSRLSASGAYPWAPALAGSGDCYRFHATGERTTRR